jgi:hypothetical protein
VMQSDDIATSHAHSHCRTGRSYEGVAMEGLAVDRVVVWMIVGALIWSGVCLTWLCVAAARSGVALRNLRGEFSEVRDQIHNVSRLLHMNRTLGTGAWLVHVEPTGKDNKGTD